MRCNIVFFPFAFLVRRFSRSASSYPVYGRCVPLFTPVTFQPAVAEQREAFELTRLLTSRRSISRGGWRERSIEANSR